MRYKELNSLTLDIPFSFLFGDLSLVVSSFRPKNMLSSFSFKLLLFISQICHFWDQHFLKFQLKIIYIKLSYLQKEPNTVKFFYFLVDVVRCFFGKWDFALTRVFLLWRVLYLDRRAFRCILKRFVRILEHFELDFQSLLDFLSIRTKIQILNPI